jgi:hypothetical protein
MKLNTARNPLVLIAALLVAGCVTHSSNQSGSSNVAPQLVVEQFLRAVNGAFESNDAVRNNSLETMARLFGTRDGSIIKRDPRKDVDQRMFALASILRHDDYAIGNQQLVPGRQNEAIRLMVSMKFGPRNVNVPYTMVKTTKGDWLIEQIDVEPITSRP